ncbi:MAG: hypothetical protein AAB352_02085 [Patescibacteria group bacterium]
MDTYSNTPFEENTIWKKAIPRTNIGFAIPYLLLVFGLDLMIIISSPELKPFWYMMLGVLALFAFFFYFENFIFNRKFANSTSSLDGVIMAIIVLRNILFLLNFIPLIQLLGLAGIVFVGWIIGLIYLGLIIARFSAVKSVGNNDKNYRNISTLIIGIIAVLILVIGGFFAYQYYYIPKQETKNSVTETPKTKTPKNEIADWNSYTYLSTQSGILPDISFEYPSLFGNNPSLISSRNVNRPENITSDWGGFVEFNPTGAFSDRGLRIEFFKKSNYEASFENYVTKSATAGGWGSPKYFQVGNYKVARLRFASSSHYDADVGWYFIEFPNKVILAVSTSGDKKFLYDDDKNENSTRDKIISALKFSEANDETSQTDFSKLNKDELLHKMFPNLFFENGKADLSKDKVYNTTNLYLKKSTEDYFINKKEKSLLLIAQLDGVAHAGGLYHAYLGLFDKNGNLLTPASVLPKPNVQNPYGDDYYDFAKDEAQFGGDSGQFGFYDCNGLKYILFVSTGWPNSTCGSDAAYLYKINNGNFEKIQTINEQSLGGSSTFYYGLKMVLSGSNITIKKVPPTSDQGNCAETDYKKLLWNRNVCRFE